MKHRELPSFLADLRRLTAEEREAFLRILRNEFHPACERFAADPASVWPRALRVKRVQGTRSVWEMTWSFAGPDGRATFEWLEVDGELGICWRRIGGHVILDRP